MKLRLNLTFAALAVSIAAMASEKNFVIAIDPDTFDSCRDEIALYASSLRQDGFTPLVLAHSWATPEDLRARLQQIYREKGLEGAVFIGDIPIAMVQRAQHFCSAFKMQQDPEDLFNTSVPSDRFYDDFDLAFDYISRQDTLGARYFYYNLRGDCPQEICCEIYTGRIKPTLDGAEGHRQVADYLRKVVRIKAENNPVDHVVSYTGEGSFSNSLVAWKDETITLREQFPAAYGSAAGVKFYFFDMFPFPKDVIQKELARENVDIFLFHEHGVPERQYLSNDPDATGMEAYYEDAKRLLRARVARQLRYGYSEEETIAKLKADYDLDDCFFEGLHDPKVAAADSLYDLHTGIILDDVHKWNPNPVLSIFDACYNGDFREKDCIASSYIFGSGRSCVSLGNSVNVLQDKSSSDLLGLLAAGYCVGDFARFTNIMESHIIGDPTFHFTRSTVAPALDLRSSDTDYWLGVLDDKDYSCDERGVALYQLYRLRWKGLSDKLLEVYSTSEEYMLRLQAMHLSAHYADGNYIELLRSALDDPYEFIRRKGVYYAGRTGDPSLVDAVAKMYLYDYTSKRICFNITSTAGFWGPDAVPSAVEALIDSRDDIFDPEAFKAARLDALRRGMSMYEFICEIFRDKARMIKNRSYITSLRNNPYPELAPVLLEYVTSDDLAVDLRVALTEALGWYVRCGSRSEIVSTLKEMLSTGGLNAALEDEIHKTINRLDDYLR